MKLGISAYLLTEKAKGERVGDSSFEIDAFRVEEEEGKLLFIASLLGPARDMSDELCADIHSQVIQADPFQSIREGLWPNLTAEQYEQLSTEFVVTTELVSEENNNFLVRCQ